MPAQPGDMRHCLCVGTAASIDRSLGERREAEALGILSHVSPAGFDMLNRRNPTARNKGGGLSQQLFAGIDWKAQLCNRRFTPVSEAC
jgi:hypothetical protein